ncbi:Nitrogen regulatory protein P-II 1 [Ferriphaselus amnicola]|uniref:Nitrogen regulatory protein P-II 1 n=1 Tax=Ferriphaselus amnicola TaxID=1188319 RepID=A0A2Z6G8V7_9PROT|nr:P-II family nitrogen regulator [Ferriphaselus amnicola]BBE49878.1 Nitrogen regulatory protein P-II 1 [Ferriphaselus amnicola]
MKEIKAIIQPKRLERIRDAFRNLPGFPGMTILKVQGCSGHQGLERHNSLRAELTEFSDKVRLEIVTPDEHVTEIVKLIHQHAYSGKQGDGLLWVTEVGEVHRLSLPPN